MRGSADELSDCVVDADAARAETLPPRAFTDPAFLAREWDTVFRRSWLLVPPRPGEQLADDPRDVADLVRRRGARAPVAVAERPLFLQRDWEGVLRAFPNVCTHAWHTLVQGPERERSIVCPQHGRRFDPAGRYVGQPGFEDVAGMPRPADHLTAMPVFELGPWLFVAADEAAAPAKEVFGDLAASFAGLDLSALRRVPLEGEVRLLPGNWKQHAWNYLDELHIPFIHSKPGGLAESVDLESYRTELYPHSVLQWAYARNPDHGFDPGALPDRFRSGDRRVFALWWFVFPDLTINLYPWGVSVNVYAPVRGDPQTTRFHWYHYVMDQAKYAERERIWRLQSVDDEDVDALTQVGRGVRSGLAARGRFVPGRERGPHWLHRRVYEEVAAARR